MRPFRWPEALIRQVLPPGLSREGLLGDLQEEFLADAARMGTMRARLRHARRALGVVARFALSPHGPPRSTSGGSVMLRSLLDDVIQGVRSLAHAPGFTLLATLTLAAGVGSTTAIFSVVDGVLLRPLPYPEPDELVAVRYVSDGREMINHSEPEFLDLDRDVAAFAAVTAYTPTRPTLGAGGEPERIRAYRTTASFQQVLGVEPLLGRWYAPGEDTPDGERVVVVAHSLWTRAFASDPGVLGTTILLEDVPHTVIGVMPQGVSFPDPDVQAWMPLRLDRANPWARNNHYLGVAARLASDVGLPAAAAELDALGARITAAYPEFYSAPVTFRAQSLRESMVGDVRTPLLLLLGAVVGVLLIASVNAAALFLARGEARRAEVAVRMALGAGRTRLAGQLLAESAAVGVGAAVAGVALTYGGVAALRALSPAELPRLAEVGVDARVLVFGLAIALVTSLLFGLAPALQALRSDVRLVMAGGARGGIGSRRSGRFRRGLVVVQLALATALALGAGLLVRSFQALRQVELGFQPAGVLTATLLPPESVVPQDAGAATFYETLDARAAALPGVTAAGAALRLPLAGGHDNYSIVLEENPDASLGDAPSPGINWVTPGWFTAMGIPLIQGRAFTAADRADASPVAVVNERLAAELWPGENPLGKRLRMFSGDQPWMEVVGVVADVKHYGVRLESSTKLYVPHAQGHRSAYYAPNRMTLVLRTDGDPSRLAAPLRTAVRELAPGMVFGEVRTLEAVVSRALAPERFVLLLLGAFAAVGLLLAAVGVYGVVSRAVAARTREIGLRMAVGADRHRVAREILAEGLVLAGAGCGAGVVLGATLSWFVRGVLFGTSPLDGPTYLAAAALLALTACTACAVPARRAARLDPVRALAD